MTVAIKINENDGKARNVMTGGETEVDFDFPIYDDDHINIFKTDTSGVITLLAKTTNYTVPPASVDAQAGGVVNLVVAATAGEVYTAFQAVPYSRTSDFSQAGDFFADVLNKELDIITQQIQQLVRDANRTPKIPVDSEVAEVLFPEPADQKVPYWSGTDGTMLNGPSIGDIENAAAQATIATNKAAESAASAVAAAASAAVFNLYDTFADVEAADIALSAPDFIATGGYTAAGDGGGALYKRIGSEPAHAGKVQSNDGQWWELCSTVLTIEMFGAAGDGSTDDSAAIIDFYETVTTLGTEGLILGKTYGFDAFTQISSQDNFAVRTASGAAFKDLGNDVTFADATTGKTPNGFEFYQCDGWRHEKLEFIATGMQTGTSNGKFDETNYTDCKPVFSVNECKDYYLEEPVSTGSHGVSISEAGKAAIIADDATQGDTPNKVAYLSLRGSFFNQKDCEGGTVIKPSISRDDISDERENITTVGCSNMRIIDTTSLSGVEQFASVSKHIGISDSVIDGMNINDDSSGSLVDIIGSNVVLQNFNVVYDNGKLADLSQEWGDGNQPIDNVIIEDCTTTGNGPLTVKGSSTDAQVENNPITNVILQNLKTNKGVTDWSGDRWFCKMTTCINYKTIDNFIVNQSTNGFSFTNDGGQLVENINNNYRWNTNTIDVNNKTFTIAANGLAVYENCDFNADSSGSGTDLTFTGGAGGKHKFTGGKVEDTTFNVTTIDMLFIGVSLKDVEFDAAGRTITLVNCVVDTITETAGTFKYVSCFDEANNEVINTIEGDSVRSSESFTPSVANMASVVYNSQTGWKQKMGELTFFIMDIDFTTFDNTDGSGFSLDGIGENKTALGLVSFEIDRANSSVVNNSNIPDDVVIRGEASPNNDSFGLYTQRGEAIAYDENTAAAKWFNGSGNLRCFGWMRTV